MKQGDGEGSSNPTETAGPIRNLDPNPCPICLGPVNNDAYLDRCFHRYCYDCILRWTKVIAGKSTSRQAYSVVKCPLCKTDNYCIVYGYDGSTFRKHYINQDASGHFFTEAHKHRLQCYYTESAGVLSEAFDLSRYWKSGKYRQPNRWLQHWLKRELQALMQEEDVDIIMHHIAGVIESFSRSLDPKAPLLGAELKRGKFRCSVDAAARPFLTGRTERFVDEVELFLASGLTLEAYDKVYKTRLGWEKPEDVEDEVTGQAPITSYLHLFYDSSEEAD